MARVVVLLSALLPLAASAAGLSGEERASFITDTRDSCESSLADPMNDAEGFTPIITEHCTCYADALASSIEPGGVAAFQADLRATGTIGSSGARVEAARAACGANVHGTAPGLTGIVRVIFAQASMRSCRTAVRSSATNAAVPDEMIARYCSCYSNKMADSISHDEVIALGEQLSSDRPGVRHTLDERIVAARAACRITK